MQDAVLLEMDFDIGLWNRTEALLPLTKFC